MNALTLPVMKPNSCKPWASLKAALYSLGWNQPEPIPKFNSRVFPTGSRQIRNCNNSKQNSRYKQTSHFLNFTVAGCREYHLKTHPSLSRKSSVTFPYEEARHEQALWYCIRRHNRLMSQEGDKDRARDEHQQATTEVASRRRFRRYGSQKKT